MMHFVYEIRVTLSTKILMFSGLATTLLARADEVIAASCGGERKSGLKSSRRLCARMRSKSVEDLGKILRPPFGDFVADDMIDMNSFGAKS